MPNGESKPLSWVSLLVSIATVVAFVAAGMWAVFQYVGEIEKAMADQIRQVQIDLAAQVTEQTKDSTQVARDIVNIGYRLEAFISGEAGDRFTGSQHRAYDLLQEVKHENLQLQIELAGERLRRTIEGCCTEVGS